MPAKAYRSGSKRASIKRYWLGACTGLVRKTNPIGADRQCPLCAAPRNRAPRASRQRNRGFDRPRRFRPDCRKCDLVPNSVTSRRISRRCMPVATVRRKSCNRQSVTPESASSRAFALLQPEKGEPRRSPGSTSASTRGVSRRMAAAGSESGTTCRAPSFVRSGSMVQTHKSSLNSDQGISSSSPTAPLSSWHRRMSTNSALPWS